MDNKAEKLSLFRYGLIAPLVIERLPRGELTRRAQEIAARTYDIPHSKRTAVSVDTLLAWALRYRHSGFEALAPKPRQVQFAKGTGLGRLKVQPTQFMVIIFPTSPARGGIGVNLRVDPAARDKRRSLGAQYPHKKQDA